MSTKTIQTNKNQNKRNIGKEWNKGPKTKKSDHLADLFGDPEYKYEGSWDQAKAEGQKQNKWILLNVQSKDEFASHTLNRDVWKDSTTSDFIKSSFLSTDAGRQMCSYYKITEFPHVSVIDPHTGRQENILPVPSADKFPAQASAIRDKLIEWIENAPNPSAKKKSGYQPRIKATPSPQMPAVLFFLGGEDEELNKALLESLTDNAPSNDNKNSKTNNDDRKSTDVEIKDKVSLLSKKTHKKMNQ
ncbi:hypothetical protein RFI_23104 [Reticulomyxa filosa]|uniref:UAS domain-containing protein n=1 Tax=Reticulomyxa filosa TaxID=46433 RepID=X6MLD1_RETFI|nr:hypothetical protein RFI_23104 [Reticulomyxa filosa]|eukprot:ETO14262.1 hypothetical protein RFI_23104 [Reticulomyxa filosa]